MIYCLGADQKQQIITLITCRDFLLFDLHLEVVSECEKHNTEKQPSSSSLCPFFHLLMPLFWTLAWQKMFFFFFCIHAHISHLILRLLSTFFFLGFYFTPDKNKKNVKKINEVFFLFILRIKNNFMFDVFYILIFFFIWHFQIMTGETFWG